MRDRFFRWAATKRWMPSLVRTHPGFFQVCFGLIMLHLGLCLDFSLGAERHGTQAFKIVTQVLPLPLLVGVHGVTGLLLIWGLYHTFGMARWGLRLSITTFSAMAAAFGWAAFTHPAVSFGGLLLYGFVAIVSAAAAREPESNPAVGMNVHQVRDLQASVDALLSEVKQYRDES